MNTNTTIKLLGYLGLLGSILVGAGEYLLHYSTNILGHAENYEFFGFVDQGHMTHRPLSSSYWSALLLCRIYSHLPNVEIWHRNLSQNGTWYRVHSFCGWWYMDRL